MKEECLLIHMFIMFSLIFSFSLLYILHHYCFKAFENLERLASINLPATIRRIGTGAFSDTGLETVVFGGGSVLTEMGDSVC